MVSMTVLSGSYDYRLVALPIMLATFASNTALDLAERA
jgi:NO-binding membrane sensor protein with MHYT domain